MSRRRRRNDWIPGAVITIIVIMLSVVFMGLLAMTKMIPTIYMLIIGIVLAVIAAIIWLLVWHTRYTGRFIGGTVLAVIMIAILAFGGFYINKTRSAISNISGETTEVTQMAVYVKSDDAADSVEATAGYTYGILSSLDRENTDGAVAHLNSQFGTEVQTKEYAGLTELADGILNGEVNAMLLNSGYLSVYEDMDGYTDFSTKIKEVGTVDVESTIQSAEESAPIEPITTANGGKVYTIYLSGIDTRGEMTAKSRSDVNIIATVNTDTHEILLVSTPRDYFVPLSISGGAPDKLTHAGIYGIDVCMDTLGMLYDIDINYYFRINFGGFVKVIDALGGITVNSDYDFDSKNILGYHFNKGENYVNGEQALIFARERYAFQEGDRQRGKNQMEVIRGVVKKALSPEILTSYSSILSSLDGCFGTNITYEEIAQILQQQLTNGGDWTIVSYSVNGTGATEKPYSMSQKAYVMVPDYNTVDKAKSLMEKVRNGEVVTQEEADSPVSGSTSTDSTSTETVTEPGTVAAETQAATDTTAADGTTTEGTADTTTQQ
ncbi:MULTISPECIES: LCP family protein [Clostridia]|uniref:LCP family protein n=1 Tax=unclassified Ruminococcus TaxID=2608920 RepID=UPI000821D471|nr:MULTISPECIES: LCP family protein [Clostridia]SCI88261.1 Membrane-bound protein lytR [uncultured Blautia sp.]SCK04506.1 Membrane-bound protein lytR [uncultured Clostridium sp.]